MRYSEADGQQAYLVCSRTGSMGMLFCLGVRGDALHVVEESIYVHMVI